MSSYHLFLSCFLLHSSRVESSRVESSRVESSRVESSRVESSRVESSRVKSSQVESSRVKSSQVESSRVKSSQVESSRVKSSQVESSRVTIQGPPIWICALPIVQCSICAKKTSIECDISVINNDSMWHYCNITLVPYDISSLWDECHVPSALCVTWV